MGFNYRMYFLMGFSLCAFISMMVGLSFIVPSRMLAEVCWLLIGAALVAGVFIYIGIGDGPESSKRQKP